MGTAGAGFIKKSNNNDEQSVEELEQADIREKGVVVELSEGKAQTRAKRPDETEGEDVLSVPLKQMPDDRLETWFTDEQLEEMRAADMAENPDMVDQYEKSYDEMWDDVRQMVEEHNREVAKRRQEKKREEMANKDWLKEAKYTEPVRNLSGEEFVELMQEAQSDEPTGEVELQQELVHDDDLIEEEPEIDTVDERTAELAINQWEERGGVWDELAQDLRESDEKTQIETIAEDTKRITTKDARFKKELRSPEEYGVNGDVEIKEDTGETVVAVVSQ